MVTSGNLLTALIKDSHACFGLEVSVKYVHGGEYLDGFLIEDVLTPFSVAEIFDKRKDCSSTLLDDDANKLSPLHVTIVCDGVVLVLQPRRPADVAAFSVGTFVA